MLYPSASSDWIWDVLPLVAAFAAATLQRASSSYQSYRGEAWPIACGLVTSASFDVQGNARVLRVEYSYRVENTSYRGWFKKTFHQDDEAESWKDALSGEQVIVHYDSRKPSRSLLMESDLRPMVQAFASSALVSAGRSQAMSSWQRFLCQLGLVLALIGLAACALEFLSEVTGKPFLNGMS
jgi:Protein of unknown function (DUF3592)